MWFDCGCPIEAGATGTFTKAQFQVKVKGMDNLWYTSSMGDLLVDGAEDTIYICIGAVLPCTTNLSFTVQNNDSVEHVYYQSATGPAGSVSASQMGMIVLAPGQVGTSTANWPCQTASSVALYTANGGWDVNVYTNIVGGATNSYQVPQVPGTPTGAPATGAPGPTPGQAGSPNPGDVQTNFPTGSITPTNAPPVAVTPPPIYQYNPTNSNQSGTNSPILWTSDAFTNPAAATQQGFDAMQDAATKAALQAHNDAAKLSGSLTNLAMTMAGDFGGLSNVLSHFSGGGSTNINNTYVTDTNSVNFTLTNYAQEGTLEGVASNLSALVGFLGLTNSDGSTNVASYASDPGFTNYTDALAGSANSSEGLVETWYSTMLSGLVQPEVDEGGTPGLMLLTFPGTGYTLDFNPLDNADISNIFYYAKLLIQWLLCVYYVKRCLADSRWAISVCNQSHGTMNAAGIRQTS
jgi:hypothetical protein